MEGVSIAQETGHLADLRRAWLLYGLRNKILTRISLTKPTNLQTLLSVDKVADLSTIFERFVQDFNIDPSTEIAQDQPFRLDSFTALNQITKDIDAKLPSLLQDGVFPGVQASIPPSQVWIRAGVLF